MSVDLIESKRSLTPHEFEILKTEVERRRKSTGVAYLLWFFLSVFGLHKFYLGKIGEGFLYMLGPWIAFFTLVGGIITVGQPGVKAGGALAALIGVVALLAFVIWWFVDLFTLHRQTEAANEDIERAVLRQIKEEG